MELGPKKGKDVVNEGYIRIDRKQYKVKKQGS
jgi:hypothetical protein